MDVIAFSVAVMVTTGIIAFAYIYWKGEDYSRLEDELKARYGDDYPSMYY